MVGDTYKTAPIFEIDKFTRLFSNKQEIIDMLYDKGCKVKDIRLKRIAKNKTSIPIFYIKMIKNR